MVLLALKMSRAEVLGIVTRGDHRSFIKIETLCGKNRTALILHCWKCGTRGGSMRGVRFSSVEELSAALTRRIRSLRKTGQLTGIMNISQCWRAMFEKDCEVTLVLSVHTGSEMFYLDDDTKTQLQDTLEDLLIDGKGILLAADTIGVVFSEETAYELSASGKPLKDAARDLELLVGILFNYGRTRAPKNHGTSAKPDDSTPCHRDQVTKYYLQSVDDVNPLPWPNNTPNLNSYRKFVAFSKATDLSNPDARFKEYWKQGFRFAFWHCKLDVTDEGICSPPVDLHISANAMANFAAGCQLHGILPILEIELISERNHDLEFCSRIHQSFLTTVIDTLHDHHVDVSAVLLSPSLITPGSSCPTKYEPRSIAEATFDVLKAAITRAFPGVALMSGTAKLSQEDVVKCLNALCSLKSQFLWRTIFCFGQPLQNPALKAWKGAFENAAAAQEAFINTLIVMSYASRGLHGSSEENYELSGEGFKEYERERKEAAEQVKAFYEEQKREERRKKKVEEKILRALRYKEYGLPLETEEDTEEADDLFPSCITCITEPYQSIQKWIAETEAALGLDKDGSLELEKEVLSEVELQDYGGKSETQTDLTTPGIDDNEIRDSTDTISATKSEESGKKEVEAPADAQGPETHDIISGTETDEKEKTADIDLQADQTN